MDLFEEMLMRNAKWRSGQGSQWAANKIEASQPFYGSDRPFPESMSGKSKIITNPGAKYLPGGVRASAGTVLSDLLALYAAATGGWAAGRTLGNTPLMTDPSMTYDDFYTQLFRNMMKRKPGNI